MLDYCCHHLPAGSNLTLPVSKKLEKVKVYARIMSTCHNPLSSQLGEATGQLPEHRHPAPWKTWVDLAKDSETKSNFVLRILLESKEFDLSREWCRVHELGSSVTRQIEVDYLFDLLEGGNPDPIVAHQKLDSLSDNKMSLEVCEALVAEKMTALKMEVAMTEVDLKTMVFVLEYMLTWLSISIANKKNYSNLLLGVKALLCLPCSAYDEYKHLIRCPQLLVEQLVMDLKIDWAASVIRELRSAKLLHMLSTSDTPSLSCRLMEAEEEGGKDSGDPFSKILMFYCNRALDFPQPVLINCTPASSVMHSVQSSEPATPALMMSGNYRCTTPAAASGRTAASGFKVGHHRHISLADQYPAATPRIPLGFNRSNSVTMMMSSTEVGSVGGKGFQPPQVPPPRELWDKDMDTKECRICETHFGMFIRRHHCRSCGRVVCATCSSHVDPVKGYDRSVRTCDSCHNRFSPHASSDTGQHPEGMGTAAGGGASDSAECTWIAGMLLNNSCDQENSWTQNVSYPLHQNYKLISGDLVANTSVRSEFYYERTPNKMLCLSLADLLTDRKQAAVLILDCCHTVSAQLVPDSLGRVNAELDHYFVISLIQNLLLNAKLRFAEANANSGVELCDTYLSRVDILRLLVSSRYNKIPSIQELRKPDLARRVRDRLIQDDRFCLAMEVSTKCQLDTVAVWSAWGVACLKSGDFSEARSKLKHCFQVSYKSGSSGQNSHLLQRIIEQIEQHPLSVAGKHTRLSDDWSGVVLGSTAITQKRPDEYDIDSVRFSECVYYLHTYGSHSSTVAFYIKHLSWIHACSFILDHNCSSDVFVECFWIPVLKSGMVEKVMMTMKELDPSLGSWEHYLTAACCYFSKKSLFSVLLTTQLFMNDFIRAGLTCIKFFIGFSGRSTTITDLFERLCFLDQAIKHFQTSLNSKTQGADRGRSMRERVQRVFEDPGISGGTRGSSLAVKSMNVSELHSHLGTVSLQKKVVICLYQSAKAMGTLRDPLCIGSGPDFKSSNTNSGRPMPLSPPPSSSSSPSPTHCSSPPSSSSSGQPPTLFRNSHVRAEVAALVIICCRDLGEGFNIAKDIIEYYKLNLRQVFSDAARGFALRQRYGDIRVLLQYILKDYQSKVVSIDALNDDIIMAAIKVLANQSREGKQVEKLVAMLSNERNKIKALVQCGKLKAAYLVAIRARLADEVQRISEIANKAGQLSVRYICNKWLQANAPYLLKQQ